MTDNESSFTALVSSMESRCKICMANGVEMPAISGLDLCAMHALAGTCQKCSTKNGELEDSCRQCGADLRVHIQGGRKLKPHASHEDAPAKKVPQVSHLDMPVDSIPPPQTEDPNLKHRIKVYQYLVGSIN